VVHVGGVGHVVHVVHVGQVEHELHGGAGGHVVHVDGLGHVVHVGHFEHELHVVCVGHFEHELHVGGFGQVGKLVVVVVVVVFETGGAEQLQHPEVMCVKFIYVVPPPQIGRVGHVVQELIVVVVMVVSVMVLTEPVYTVVISVVVTVNVFGAGHVSDFECGQLDDGVQGGRVGVYHRTDVVSPSPRSRFLASATKRPSNVAKSKNFIFQSTALAQSNTEKSKTTKESGNEGEKEKEKHMRNQLQ
jgi:hypothetical protein